MPRSHPNPKNHLSYLQRNSWEIELLVSAVALGLLWPVSGWLESAAVTVELNGEENPAIGVAIIAIAFLAIAFEVLFILFVIHFTLRSMWVAALGLSSVSREPLTVKFRARPFFSRWLTEKIPSSTAYIAQLDKRASIHLSLAFLLFCARAQTKLSHRGKSYI